MGRVITIHTDGGARGNPGPAAIGVYVEEGSKVLFSLSEHIGVHTNNYAEYFAIYKALQKLTEQHLSAGDRLQFFLDSLLVVSQLNGTYKVKDAQLLNFYTQVKQFEKQLSGVKIEYTHVPRENNVLADRLVNQALDIVAKKY